MGIKVLNFAILTGSVIIGSLYYQVFGILGVLLLLIYWGILYCYFTTLND